MKESAKIEQWIQAARKRDLHGRMTPAKRVRNNWLISQAFFKLEEALDLEYLSTITHKDNRRRKQHA